MNREREQKSFPKSTSKVIPAECSLCLGGERKRVSIRFRNHLLDTAIERFGTGKDVFYRPDDNEHFVVTADVEISDQFFAWVCGFGKRAKIIAPNETISMIKDFVCNIKSLYDN